MSVNGMLLKILKGYGNWVEDVEIEDGVEMWMG